MICRNVRSPRALHRATVTKIHSVESPVNYDLPQAAPNPAGRPYAWQPALQCLAPDRRRKFLTDRLLCGVSLRGGEWGDSGGILAGAGRPT